MALDSLESINEELRRRGLKLLRKLGDDTQGEDRIIRILEIWDRMSAYYTYIVYEVQHPDGSLGEYGVKYNANSLESEGMVVIAKINGRLAVVYQYRPSLQVWTYELPRGYESEAARDETSPGFAVACLRREIGDRLVDSAMLHTHRFLGNVPDNTGDNAMACNYWLLELSVSSDAIVRASVNKPVNGRTLLLWNNNVLRSKEGRQLRDAHSLTALQLLQQFETRSM